MKELLLLKVISSELFQVIILRESQILQNCFLADRFVLHDFMHSELFCMISDTFKIAEMRVLLYENKVISKRNSFFEKSTISSGIVPGLTLMHL